MTDRSQGACVLALRPPQAPWGGPAAANASTRHRATGATRQAGSQAPWGGPASALLALWNDVEASFESEYNDWQTREHMPERCRVPGVLWGRRYRLHDQPQAALPRYLTLYGLRDEGVLETPAYRHLLNEPTPMSRRMRPVLSNLSRWVCRVQEDEGPWEAAGRLAVWALGSAADANADADAPRLVIHPGDPHLLARRLHDADPQPWLRAEPARGVQGGWLLGVAAAAGELQGQSGGTPYQRCA